jgi:hypothetical protein
LDKNRTLRTQKAQVCETCQKPLPDAKAFREIVISCLKQGFYVLETKRDNRTLESPYCVCKSRIMSRLLSTHRHRSRVKRRMAFIAKVEPHKRKSKRSLLNRGDKPEDKSKRKALQRQMRAEDLVLWDWELFDEVGNPHHLEDVLDTPLIRRMINGPSKWCGESPEKLENLERILGQLATDPTLVTTATMDEPIFDQTDECEETWSDVEELWRKRLDDEE